ncbi:MAG: CinA-like protein [Chthoniobacteraceae bacterium]|nr:CinA-like protein [Chthoniobacteraceae bacterium]
MNPRLEVINTGTELLLGSVINTHLQFLAEALFPLGLRIERQVTVPDGRAIADALQETFGRAQIVLITGGLGPTTDDITRDIVAELLNLELVHDEGVMQAIEERFIRRGFTLGERVRLQALRPREAIVLPNQNGTAPGLYLPPLPLPNCGQSSPHIFLLPGPPRELKPMFNEAALPLLQKLVPAGASEFKRNYRITGTGESHVEERIGAELLALGIELGYCARPGEVDVRIIGSKAILDRAETIVLRHFATQIVSRDESSLEKVVIELLAERSQTLGVAESCTGGFLAHHLTNVPGASRVFQAGFVTYANDSKRRELGVPAELILEHGAVSAEVALAMARGVVRVADVDYALATTGIAGPGGGTPTKPVGTVYVALASRQGKELVRHFTFRTDRETFKTLTTQAALDLLRQQIQ